MGLYLLVHYLGGDGFDVVCIFLSSQRDKIKENKEKIKLNKQLPWLVGNVVEVRIRSKVKMD